MRQAEPGAGGSRSQARLAGELEELGYHVTQSMVSRYEQGLLEAPLTLERMVGWALCCEALSARLQGAAGPGRVLPAVDAADLRRSTTCCELPTAEPGRPGGRCADGLLWHILGIETAQAGGT